MPTEEPQKPKKRLIKNPEWEAAKYEMGFHVYGVGATRVERPLRSNNPNALSQNDWIPEFIEVDDEP